MMTILLSCTAIGNAQLIKSYGVKLAYTSASQNIDYPTPPWGWWTGIKASAKPGFNIAAFAEWLNVPFFSVVSQIEYAQRGANLKYPLPGGWSSTDGRLDYLTIPILAKVTLPIGSGSPYLLAGPRADFLFNYRDVEIQMNTNPFYSDFKKVMFGGSIGVGVQTGSLLPIALLAELRYNFDFLDSYNNDYLKVRNNAFDIWVGVVL
jgi:hypothetical protein